MGEWFAGLAEPAGVPALFAGGGASVRNARRVMAAWVAVNCPGLPFAHVPGRVLRADVGAQRYRYQCQEGGTGAFGFSIDSLRADADPQNPASILLFQCLPGDQKNDGFRCYRCWLYAYASPDPKALTWASWLTRDSLASRHIDVVKADRRSPKLVLVEDQP